MFLSHKIKYPYGESLALVHLGFTYDVIDNLPKALELYLKSLKIAEKYALMDAKAHALERIASIHRKTNKYALALSYRYQAKQLFDSLHITNMWILQLHNICRIYTDMNQLDSALYYANQTYENAKKYKLERLYFLNNFGRIYTKKGDTELALRYSKEALLQAYKQENYNRIAEVSSDIAKIYKPLNRDSSLYYAKMSLLHAQTANLYSQIIDAASLLAELYEGIENSKTIQYYKTTMAAKDSIAASTNANALNNITDFDEQERQYEIEAATTAIQNQNKQYALLAGLGVFLLIALILYLNNRQKQKANNLLHQQKQEIDFQRNKAEKALIELQSTQAQLIQKEKLASLGELTAGIAHEIQNPLNFVNNFSELSVELVEELKVERAKVRGERDEELENELLSDLAQNQEKINLHGKRASSIVKGMLEHSRASTGVKELTDINKLADEYLRLSYHGMKAKDKSFEADYDLIVDESLPLVNVVPQDMGRVLLNLINNAFQSQAPQPPEGGVNYTKKVVVKTFKIEGDSSTPSGVGPSQGWGLSVSDNGSGIPADILPKIFQPFFTTKPTGEGTGLGLSLAYDIVTKGHGGTLEVESVEGEGATFSVRLPFSAINSK